MCIGGKKNKGPSAAELAAQARAADQARLVEEQRVALKAQNDALAQSQRAFQETQNSYIGKIEQLTEQAMAREAAQFEALTAAQHASRLPSLVQTNNGQEEAVSEEDQLLDSARRGRRALRIDLNAPTTAGPTSALNVPRG